MDTRAPDSKLCAMGAVDLRTAADAMLIELFLVRTRPT
jgi:hypothetical protein